MKPSFDQRKRDLGRIHILSNELGLTRDQYEAVLWTQATVESSKNLDQHQRTKVINHLEALLKRSGKTPKRRQRAAFGKVELVAKIRKMLMTADPPRNDAYADAMAKRMFNVDQFTWCEPDQLRRLVAALSYDRKRKGT